MLYYNKYRYVDMSYAHTNFNDSTGILTMINFILSNIIYKFVSTYFIQTRQMCRIICKLITAVSKNFG